MLQLRGYISGDKDEETLSATHQIAEHLFKNLRGTDNLVFAGSRQLVEIYADRLRNLCEEERLPQEFYPHHASLSRDHRDFVERRLKDGTKPTTAVCTSTLELWIDIGDATCVAQIGAAFSVAALRQRLGRSWPQSGPASHTAAIRSRGTVDPESNYVDRLRLGLIRTIAFQKSLISVRRKSSFHPARLNLTRSDPLSVFAFMMLSAMRPRAAKLMGALSFRARC